MALASTVFVPLFGVMSLAALLGIIKLFPALLAIPIKRQRAMKARCGLYFL
jgi:hypothetical protein